MAVTRGGSGITCQRLAQAVDGLVLLASLMSEHTKQMQRAGMRGIDMEDLPIDVFCLGDARLMVSQGQGAMPLLWSAW